MSQATLKPEEGRVQPWHAINGDATLRLDYPLDKDSIVYDVGGYLGEWAEPIYQRYKCQIEIFEPVEGFISTLQKKFKNTSKVHIHPFALGGKKRNLRISLADESSSVFKSSGQTQQIKIVAAKEVIPANFKINLMKINIEGGEYELLDHLVKTGLIHNIKNIQVQFHIFVPAAKKKRALAHKQLSKTHELTYCYPWIWENWKLK